MKCCHGLSCEVLFWPSLSTGEVYFSSFNNFTQSCVCLTGNFSVHSYRTFVSEDAGPNTLVATVLAKDPDGDGITYKITSGNDDGNFIIDSQKGDAP